MSQFSCTLSDQADGIVVSIRGDLGVGNVPLLERQLMSLSARKPGRVVIDMSGVEFISSLGLGSLVQFQRGLLRHQGQVRLAALAPLVEEAIKRSRLDVVLKLFPSVEAALAS
jgi:anti-sigma B factor antagonist